MNRMNSDMRDADSAIGRNDLKAAHDYLQKADREITTLESFLGR
jgi:flagellin-specific chaperone FliS